MEDKPNHLENIFSEKVRAGKRTYYFDVRATRSKDYYLTITEIKKKFNSDIEGFTFEKHKIFLYKEDFNKFENALRSSLNYMKRNLMQNIDFSQFEGSNGDDGNSHKDEDNLPGQESDLNWD